MKSCPVMGSNVNFEMNARAECPAVQGLRPQSAEGTRLGGGESGGDELGDGDGLPEGEEWHGEEVPPCVDEQRPEGEAREVLHALLEDGVVGLHELREGLEPAQGPIDGVCL